MRKLTGLVFMAILASASVAWAEPTGTFRQAHEVGSGNASDLDPISKGRVFQITEKIMSRLVRPSMEGTPSPDLAVSWSANSDATVWTFKLRSGVKFHDGKPFTSEDAVYSLQRVIDPKLDSPAKSTLKGVTKIEAIDPLTLSLTLAAPKADLPLVLTDYRLRMIPAGSGDTIKSTGIGTGPFKVEKFDPQGVTVLTANMDYWEGAPGVARMEIVGIPDAQARLQALLGGQLDMEPGISRQQSALIQRNPKLKLQEVPTGNWRGIVLRTDVKPFDDVRVRKAIRMAVDRKAMVGLVAAGAGFIGCDTPVGPKDQYRLEEDVATMCPQDIKGAKALLAEAGYPDGIDFDLYVSTVESVWPTIAEAFQQQVAAAGIRVKIVQVPSDGYWSQVWLKKDATMTRWNERPADSLFNEVYRTGASWNESHQSDPKFDAMLDAAGKELDFAKRKDMYAAIQRYLWENTGTYVVYHATVFVGLSARVKDLDAVENFSIRWNRVRVD